MTIQSSTSEDAALRDAIGALCMHPGVTEAHARALLEERLACVRRNEPALDAEFPLRSRSGTIGSVGTPDDA